MMEVLLQEPLIWFSFSFALFAVMAYVLGKKTVLGILDGKIAKIAEQISSAEKLKSDAEALLKKYQNDLASASSEADAIIAKAKSQAADFRKQAEAEFNETMARREEMLKNRIEQMERSAMDDIRRYAAELAVSATTEIISQKLSVNDAQRLADDSIRQISEKFN